MAAKIRVCPKCRGHNSECPHCGGGGADDARRGLNVVGGVYKPPGSGLTTEEFAKRAAQNKLAKQRAEEEYERKEAERRERIRWEEMEEERRVFERQERIRLHKFEKERKERERLRIEASRRRQLAWFGRIVDGSEPLIKPLNWWEKIVWFLMR